MTEQRTFTLAHSAEMIGIKAATLRRWADYHSEYLSTTAKPLAGQPRRFTSRDIEILKYVVDLRSQGLTVGDINSQLRLMTFPDVDTTEDVAGSGEDSTELAPVASQERLQQSPGVVVAMEAMQRQIDGLQQARRFDAVGFVGLGIVIGLVFATMFIALASLYGG